MSSIPVQESAFPAALTDTRHNERVRSKPELTLFTSDPTIKLGWHRYSHVGCFTKRLLDLVLSGVLLVLLAPVFAAIALAVRMTSPGPALFKQTRVGFGEQPFTIYKFRTMRSDNDDTAHREFVQSMLRGELSADDLNRADADPTIAFKLADDPRITRLGAWLRRTSLDELPQLLNVAKGEMSLVGPRPSLFYELSEYAPRHRLRAVSVPGMTGLWQVAGRSSLHMQEALDLDVTYIETCSLATDLSILARTVKVVAKGV